MREFGVWRSWLAHLVWDQRVLCSSHSTPTKEEETMMNRLLFDSGNLEGTFTRGTIGKARMKTAQNINGNCSGYGTHCHNTEH